MLIESVSTSIPKRLAPRLVYAAAVLPLWSARVSGQPTYFGRRRPLPD